MVFENRNGRSYYYRKTRIGDRVTSEYVGAGEVAGYASLLDQYDFDARESERIELREMESEAAELDADLDDIFKDILTLIDGHLLISGFHQHKGQWRKKRKT